jgi:uncharacterized membrane protein
MILSESEKNRIAEMHMLNENFLGKLLNRFKNSKIYRTVEKVFDTNPKTFVENIIKEIPKLEKVKDELQKRIDGVSKMSDEEKEKYLKDNNVDLEKNIDTAEKEINEQTQMGAGAVATGGGISFGSIFMVLMVVVLIYILVGLSTQKKRNAKKEEERKREEEEKRRKEEEERQRQEQEKLKYKKQNDKLKNTFLNKTLNLYNDSNQQSLNSNFSPFVITDIEFKQINKGLKGIVIKGNSKESFEGLLGGNLVASCKTNPDEFSSTMGVFSRFGDNKQEVFYNNKFTSKLNEIGSQWCAKPNADFGSIDNTDVSNLA